MVSCPVYLSPATTRTKPIRLRQVWQPGPPGPAEDILPHRGRERRHGADDALDRDDLGDDTDRASLATPITIRPHDPRTGEEIEKSEVVKGYEYGPRQFVTFTRDELKALDVESSEVIDLETFVPRGDIDPVYFDTPYYLYPDGPIAVETIRIIGAAIAEAGVAGIGRLTLSRRERLVMVEPRGTGMALFTLRSAEEVRAPQFASAADDLDPEMVAIAGVIIRQRTGKFDPKAFRDRYQEALRQLIEAKTKGLSVKRRAVSTPAPVFDLMAALKRSLAQEQPSGVRHTQPGKQRDAHGTTDRRQAALLLPLSSGRKGKRGPVDRTTTAPPRRNKI